ncbi:MAG TPA: ABC transporter substrate-binding protein [Trebonia sp.]|nr:ABC transporter substrate-binding protein [Trebonia sp.]
MPRTGRGRRTARRLFALTTVAAAALTVAACTGSATGDGAASSSSSQNKATVRFAEFPASIPNWILPITNPEHDGTPNTQEFSYLMWRPLYWEGTGSSPTIDSQYSVAYPPVYSDGNRVVTIKLRDYNWSDGQPVTSRDVQFWFNLVKSEPQDWSSYVKGYLPDNVSSLQVVNNKTFKLTLTSAVSPDWFSSDQLPLIVPLPQQAWDKTSSSGKVGNYDLTSSGARSVLNYLFQQSAQLGSYTGNPLWQTIDGPWKLTGFSSDGNISFVPNTAYTGPVKPTYQHFDEVPFATADAEFNSLLAGDVDYGYLPFSDLQQESRVTDEGYHFSAWNLWTVNFIAINYDSAATGPIVKQLYVRQALESLVDQPLIIKQIFGGEGVQNFSPIPTSPTNPYSSITKNPDPYDPAKAVSLLKQHGWQVKPNGTTTCVSPGTGPTQCGAGIAGGTKLGFNLIVNSGNQPVDLEMQALQSTFSQQAGIRLNVRPEPFTQVISNAFASCTAAQPSACPWQMADWGGGENLLPYPTGEQIFDSSGASNSSHYDSPTADQLVRATHVGGTQSLAAYNSYLAQQVPVIWLPNLTYQLSMISNGLKGADAQNPYTGITPEAWHW